MEYMENNFDRKTRESKDLKDLKIYELEERLTVLEKKIADLEVKIQSQQGRVFIPEDNLSGKHYGNSEKVLNP